MVPTMSAGSMSGVNCSRLKRTDDAGGQGLERQGFGQAGHAFQQDVAVGEQGDQQPVEQVLLADDDPGHFLLQGRDPGRVVHHIFAGGAHGGVGLDRHGA